MNAGMHLTQNPCEPALPIRDGSLWLCLGQVWGDSSQVGKVGICGKPGPGVFWSPESLSWQLEALGNLSDDMRRHFRMKLRNLFIKFIRKFG